MVNHILFVAMALFITGWFGWQEVKAQGADWLPIKYIRIEGAFQYIAKENIKQVLTEQVYQGLYNADIQQIKKSVNQLPWVKKVRVKRVWPDAIKIKIIEQSPVVRWGSNGLLNEKGELFEPGNINEFKQLPLLVGHSGNEKKLLEIMKGLTVALDDKKMKLLEFRVNERRAWIVKLENNLKLRLGRNEPLNKFQQFLHTFSLLGEEHIAKVAVVDLRYPNGYALTWKHSGEVIDWEKYKIKNESG